MQLHQCPLVRFTIGVAIIQIPGEMHRW